MLLREATLDDVWSIVAIRKEDEEVPLRVDFTEQMLWRALQLDCKAYVCEFNGHVVGFSLVNKRTRFFWGLFVKPQYQSLGVGSKLHDMALDWLFEQKRWFRKPKKVSLTTKPDSKAYHFYEKRGWEMEKTMEDGEVMMSLKREDLSSS